MQTWLFRDAKDYALAADYPRAAIAFVICKFNEKHPQEVWARWKRSLGRRKNYALITERLVAAILQEFHTGGPGFRATVAQMFGLPKKAAKLSVEKLVEAIRRKRVREYPVPAEVAITSLPPNLDLTGRRYRYPKLSIQTNGRTIVDLRKDAIEVAKLIRVAAEHAEREAAKLEVPPCVSGVTLAFYLCQAGWVSIHFDTRTEHKTDGTGFLEHPVNVPAWRRSHHLLQAHGGTVILPGGKKLTLASGVSCTALKKIHGGMLKQALLNARKAGVFAKLSRDPMFKMDVEEFDGMWGWRSWRRGGEEKFRDIP